MIAPTHLIVGQSAYPAACIALAHPPVLADVCVAMGAALIPDLDSRASYAGRLLPPLSDWIERRFGHRGLTYSLLAQFLAGALALWLLPMSSSVKV